MSVGGSGCRYREGLRGSEGFARQQVYPGFFYDTGITAQGGGIPGLLSPGPSPLGAPTTATTVDIDAQEETLNNNPTARIGDSNTWVNLGSFSSRTAAS